MFLTFLIVAIISLTLMALTIYISLGVLFLCTGAAVKFSRIAFSLLLAVPLDARLCAFSNGTANYFLCVGIVLGGICLLSLLPRMDLSVKFLCTSFMTYLAVTIVVGLFLSIYSSFNKTTPHISLGVDIATKAVVLIVCYITLVNQIGEGAGVIHTNNPIVLVLQRIVASPIYALAALLIISTSPSGNYTVPLMTQWIIFLGGSGLFFVLDHFLLGEAVN